MNARVPADFVLRVAGLNHRLPPVGNQILEFDHPNFSQCNVGIYQASGMHSLSSGAVGNQHGDQPQQGNANPPQEGNANPPQEGNANPPQEGNANNLPQQGNENPPDENQPSSRSQAEGEEGSLAVNNPQPENVDNDNSREPQQGMASTKKPTASGSAVSRPPFSSSAISKAATSFGRSTGQNKALTEKVNSKDTSNVTPQCTTIDWPTHDPDGGVPIKKIKLSSSKNIFASIPGNFLLDSGKSEEARKWNIDLIATGHDVDKKEDTESE